MNESNFNTIGELYSLMNRVAELERRLNVPPILKQMTMERVHELENDVRELQERLEAEDKNRQHLLAQRDAEIERATKLESVATYWQNKYDDLVKLLEGIGIRVFPGGVMVPADWK